MGLFCLSTLLASKTPVRYYLETEGQFHVPKTSIATDRLQQLGETRQSRETFASTAAFGLSVLAGLGFLFKKSMTLATQVPFFAAVFGVAWYGGRELYRFKQKEALLESQVRGLSLAQHFNVASKPLTSKDVKVISLLPNNRGFKIS